MQRLRGGMFPYSGLRIGEALGLRAKDRDVLARAHSEARLVVTFDKDFGELAVRHRLPAASGVVPFRLHGSGLRRTAWHARHAASRIRGAPRDGRTPRC